MAREEVFGPALPIWRVKDMDEAIELANDSPFGLGSCVWTSDLDRAERAAAELDCGYTWINSRTKVYDELPFGGLKASGYGKEHGSEALDYYTDQKSVVVTSSIGTVRRSRSAVSRRRGMTVVQPALAPPRIVSEDCTRRQPILRSEMPLEPYEASLGVLCGAGRARRPDRVFLAERDGDGEWVNLTWGEANRKATSIAQALLDRGLGPAAPAAAPVRQRDRPRAADARRLPRRRARRPGLAGVLADEPGLRQGQAHRGAGQARARLRGRRRAVRRRARARSTSAARRSCSPRAPARRAFCRAAGHARRPAAVDDALAAVGPDSLAKVLFTSGSTAMPKGVLNTHGMLVRQPAVASRRSGRSPTDTPPVLVDWLPWNHTFGGNHNFNLILKRGGTLYIDAGRPAPPLIPITVRNLTEIAPTIYFNVPAGYGALLPFLERDAELRARFFERLDLIFYAAAALPAGPVDAAGGGRARGARRAGDDDLLVGADRDVAAGHRGALPDRPRGRDRRARARAWRSSSTPVEGKLEMRVKGPNVTPGYLGQPELDGQGVRRGRLVPHRRRRQARGPRRPEPGPRVRRPRGRGLQAADGHVRVGRQPADRGARRRLAAADGRRGLRARPRLRRRCSPGRTSAPRARSRARRRRELERARALARAGRVRARALRAPTTAPTRRPRRASSA